MPNVLGIQLPAPARGLTTATVPMLEIGGGVEGTTTFRVPVSDIGGVAAPGWEGRIEVTLLTVGATCAGGGLAIFTGVAGDGLEACNVGGPNEALAICAACSVAAGA